MYIVYVTPCALVMLLMEAKQCGHVYLKENYRHTNQFVLKRIYFLLLLLIPLCHFFLFRTIVYHVLFAIYKVQVNISVSVKSVNIFCKRDTTVCDFFSFLSSASTCFLSISILFAILLMCLDSQFISTAISFALWFSCENKAESKKTVHLSSTMYSIYNFKQTRTRQLNNNNKKTVKKRKGKKTLFIPWTSVFTGISRGSISFSLSYPPFNGWCYCEI